MIRRATRDDIPFLLDVARSAYGARFESGAAATFIARALGEPSMIVLRGEHGGAVASMTRSFYDSAPRAYLLFIASRPGRGLLGEGVALVRAVDAWRRERGAIALHFGEDTGVNLAPIARRLGAAVDRPSYVIVGGESKEQAAVPVRTGPTLLDRVLLSPHLLGGRPALRVVVDKNG